MIELIAATKVAPEDLDEAPHFEVALAKGVFGADAAQFGLVVPQTGASILLFLSPTCNGCSMLADTFKGTVPDHVTIVLTAGQPAVLRKWALDHRLDDRAIVYDDERVLVESLGIDSSPTAVGTVEGKFAMAVGIPGPKAFAKVYREMSEYSTGFVLSKEHK
jgi:hypothetical protein